MEPITKFEDCIECRDCCTFYRDDDAEAAPVFTKAERDNVELGLGIYGCFESMPGDLFKAKLINYKQNEYLACIFLDQESHKCKIYLDRPMDCKLWPYVVLNNHGTVELRCFKIDRCPSMMKKGQEFVAKHHELMKKIFSERYKKYYSEHPAIIANCDKDYLELTEYVDTIKL